MKTRASKKAEYAVRSYWENYFQIDDDGDMYEYQAETNTRVGDGLAASRRSTIAYFYEHVYGAPDDSEICPWDGKDGLVAKIRVRVGIPADSARLVKKVMLDVQEGIREEKEYDPHSGCRQRGEANCRIKDGSPYTAIVHAVMDIGAGITEATVLVDEYREEKNPEHKPVSWSAVQRFVSRNPLIKEKQMRTKKSGKEYPNSVWAKVRLAQAEQSKEQLCQGVRISPLSTS